MGGTAEGLILYVQERSEMNKSGVGVLLFIRGQYRECRVVLACMYGRCVPEVAHLREWLAMSRRLLLACRTSLASSLARFGRRLETTGTEAKATEPKAFVPFGS